MDITVIAIFLEHPVFGVVLDVLAYTTALHLIGIMMRRMWHSYEQHIEHTITAVVNRELCKDYTSMLRKVHNPEDVCMMAPESESVVVHIVPFMTEASEGTRKRKSLITNDMASSSSIPKDCDTWLSRSPSSEWEPPRDNIPPTPLTTCQDNRRPSSLQFENRFLSVPRQSTTTMYKRDNTNNTPKRTTTIVHNIINFVECQRRMMLSDMEKEAIVNHCHHALCVRVWFPGRASRQKIQPCLF